MTSQFASFLQAMGAALDDPARDPNFFKSNVDVLNYALTLEHLEDTFYKQVNGSGKLTGKAASYLKTIGAHETAHVVTLTQVIQKLGGTPVSAATYDFSPLGDLSTEAGILKASETLEDTGVKAYNGAAYALMANDELLAAAGSIVAVEARHVAIVRVLRNPDADPVPNAFYPLLRPRQVLDAVGPLIK